MFGTNVETMDDPALLQPSRNRQPPGRSLPYDVTDENPSWTWAGADDLDRDDHHLGEGPAMAACSTKQHSRSASTASRPSIRTIRTVLDTATTRLVGPDVRPHGELPGYNSFMG